MVCSVDPDLSDPAQLNSSKGTPPIERSSTSEQQLRNYCLFIMGKILQNPLRNTVSKQSFPP